MVMKKIHKYILKGLLFLLWTFIFSFYNVFAQVPEYFKYQAVARASNGDLIKDQKVGFRISILQGSASGAAVYIEEHVDTTNVYGLVNLQIGKGISSDDFSNINWANGPYFVQVAMDTVGGTDYILMGTSQLLSVPYAMHAKTSDKIVSADTTICNASNTGSMRYNHTKNVMEYCNSSNWIALQSGLSIGLPQLSTEDTLSVTSNSALSGGVISDNGGGEVFEKGICWNTEGAPTTSDDKILQATSGSVFTSNLTGLTSNEVYYVRSYGINTAGTGYGEELNFMTLADLSTTSASNNSLTGFKTGGDVSLGGGETISARGVVYGTNSGPTISGDKESAGAGAGSFTSDINGLPENTKYYFRAYATNAGGTNYGSEKTTATLVRLTTTDYSSPTTSSFVAGGDIAVGGDASIIARGVSYGSSSNPDISGNKTIDDTGTGSFTSTPNSLESNSLYHYRAYATNEGGTNYGADKTAITLANVSATDDATFLSYSSFSTGGTVDPGGGETVTERGIVYGLSSNPTKTDYYVVAGSGGTGNFSVNVSGLQDTGYFYRAYAINAGGVSYGPEKSFNKQDHEEISIDYNGTLYIHPVDNSDGINWYNGSYMRTSATSKTDGAANTDSIVKYQGEGSYAAKVCADLDAYGYNDWYLPAKDELNAMYQNKSSIGGFSSSYYWSSTEYDEYYGAWPQYFYLGSQDYTSKNSDYRVRCVRRD